MRLPTPHRSHLLLLMTLCLVGVARAQSGGASVAASAAVSETVALSFAEGAEPPAEGVRVTSSRGEGGTLVITISGSAREPERVKIPIRIRSNTTYKLLATTRGEGADLVMLSVAGARPTGGLVAADAVDGLSMTSIIDADSNRPRLSSPLVLMRGPRVSLGGALGSPLNALEVTLSATLERRTGAHRWAVDLLLKAEPVTRPTGSQSP